MTLDIDGNVAEASAYTAYGEIMPIAQSSTDPTREKFTGKEMDTEGAVAAGELFVDVAIPLASAGSYIIDANKTVTVSFADGTSRSWEMEANDVTGWDNYVVSLEKSLLLEEEKTIEKLDITIVYYNPFDEDNYYSLFYIVDGLSEKVELNKSKTISLMYTDTEIENAGNTGKYTPEDNLFSFVESDMAPIAGMMLQYFGARYYDPEVGLWMSVDPMDQYWSGYVYCGGNPINRFDPDGMKDKDDDEDEEEKRQAKQREEAEKYAEEKGVSYGEAWMELYEDNGGNDDEDFNPLDWQDVVQSCREAVKNAKPPKSQHVSTFQIEVITTYTVSLTYSLAWEETPMENATVVLSTVSTGSSSATYESWIVDGHVVSKDQDYSVYYNSPSLASLLRKSRHKGSKEGAELTQKATALLGYVPALSGYATIMNSIATLYLYNEESKYESQGGMLLNAASYGFGTLLPRSVGLTGAPAAILNGIFNTPGAALSVFGE